MAARGPSGMRVQFVLLGAGGMLGGFAGVAMAEFPQLGLRPETFWGTDPENVWAWRILVGATVGAGVGLLVSASRTRGMQEASSRRGRGGNA